MRDRKGLDTDGSGGEVKLGGEEGEKTIIRIYYMKVSIFNKRKMYSKRVKKIGFSRQDLIHVSLAVLELNL